MLITVCNLIIALSFGQVAECHIGAAISPYGEAIAQSTIQARIEWEQINPADLERVDGYVSSTNCAVVGNVVMVKPRRETTWYKMLVIDCPRPSGEQEANFAHYFPYLVDETTYANWRGQRIDVVGKGD